ncbi:MAG: pirin family protein, partial [Ignavibacteria bacterium]|nr:pirin family protein [Ignavibacteria bacterium]
MEKVIHKAEDRGHANHGWLDAHHSFSFANYYNPERTRFGVLRVLNDDIIQGGEGFGTHPHDNMEIITIPLTGELAHKDSTGNKEVIRKNEVQIMSAGSGLTHSEFNNSKTDEINLLQLWVFPKERNIKPRYDQKVFEPADRQ